MSEKTFSFHIIHPRKKESYCLAMEFILRKWATFCSANRLVLNSNLDLLCLL